MTGRTLSDPATVARQYADDRNLRARQRLWQISRAEPAVDIVQWSVDVLDAAAGDVVLDAGCGNGQPLALLRHRGCRVVGIDRSLGMTAATGHPTVAVADVLGLPFPDGAFDAAAAFMMLYHVPDTRRAAAELRRVVRPGGVVVATTASTRNAVELAELVEGVVGGGWRYLAPSTSDFRLELGSEALGDVFESIEVVRAPDRRVHVTDRDALADYVDSTRDHVEPGLPAGRAWAEVVDGVRSAAADIIGAEGAFVVTSRVGALVCRC